MSPAIQGHTLVTTWSCAAGPRWLPAGTLLANMAACAVGFVCVSGAVSPHVPAVVAAPLVIGVLGSLSTVSTWAEEVRVVRPAASAAAMSTDKTF